MIYTKEVLDRETQPYYWLTVYAQDSGSVPLSAFTEVFIEVDDVNDNIPQTVEPVYHPIVVEHSAEGTSVERLQAYDLDDPGDSQLTYEIISGNPQGFFTINRTTGTCIEDIPQVSGCFAIVCVCVLFYKPCHLFSS